jgi:hypothetical protein
VFTQELKNSTRTLMENSYCNFVNVKRRRSFLKGERALLDIGHSIYRLGNIIITII